LVTNAVLHAATPFTVTLHHMEDRIRVDVADANPVVPSIKDYAADAATGRGLTLFNTLASNWGVLPVVGGKIVWFELPVDYSIAPMGVSDGTFHFDLIEFAKAELHEARDRGPVVPINVLGIPVALLQKASEEYEAPHEGARRLEAVPVRTPRATLGPPGEDRHPLQRVRSRGGRELARGDRPSRGKLRLALRAAGRRRGDL
jgi:hypothetical protein